MTTRGKNGPSTKYSSHWLEGVIREFCASSPENSLKNEPEERAWDEPLVGFSSGADPLYPMLKEDIGPFYLTPLEIFRKAFPHISASPEHLTVVSWILPQTEATKADNRQGDRLAAERWLRSRYFGEIFNARLRRYVVETLQGTGFEAISPVDAPFWSREVSVRYGFSSRWSERHAAYVSGLGTFGLCDGLITPRGKAIRCGSVVARIPLPATPRPYTDHHEYCLHFSNGTCGKCMKRCPCGAITASGHDKDKCFHYLRQVVAEDARHRLGIETYGCGLCQTGVPCESRIPVESRTGGTPV